jgi:hypothetical protein
MHSIKLKSHVGSDGILQVHLPEMRNSDVELVIVYQSSAPESSKAVDFSQFYGCIQDETFVRHPQPEQTEREPLE